METIDQNIVAEMSTLIGITQKPLSPSAGAPQKPARVEIKIKSKQDGGGGGKKYKRVIKMVK